ncbi:MAG TPA: caspase family protein [Anaeromyxobacter sp.]|nr:caspase family protein [Anaeromyxobacter sp.]
MIALAAALALAAAAPAPAPRFAVVAASNEGAPGRQRLWFAEKDAERFRSALQEIGGFPAEQVAVTRGPDARAFREAIVRVEAGVAAARARGEKPLLVVYYSGHAGPGGLELGVQKVAYDELKALVAASAAEAKVVIVDACEAGTLTQVKGARVVPAVDFPLPTGNEVQGTAFVASTAVGEAAQESAALGGSFFTHHLDVALRGAGDADGDGLVTLAEAFRYTSARTVSATAATSHGPQHPTYDFRMAGRGDVVLADLRRAEAHLRIPEDPGSLYVLRGPRNLVAEVPAGAAQVRLAVPAGRYEIERRSPGGRARGDLGIGRGEERLVPVLQPTRYEAARAKGGPKSMEAFAGVGAALVSMPGGGVAPAVRAGVRREVGPAGLVVSAEYALASVEEGAFAYDWSRIGLDAALLVPVVGGRTLLEAGVFGGYGWATQALPDSRTFHAGDATAGFLARLSIPVGRLRGALDVAAGGRTFELNGSRTVEPAGSVSFVVLYGR